MTSLRPSGFDELGLRRALSDRMLPLLVAAMAFLAALALAGWFGTAALARHWQEGAGASLTVQVPNPLEPAAQAQPSLPAAPLGEHTRQAPPQDDQSRLEPAQREQSRLAAVLALLTGTPGVASAHALSEQQLADLLKPWFGQGGGQLAIPVPAVIAVRLTTSDADPDPLSRRLAAAAPGTLVEDHGIWIRRLAVLARSLQACAGLALLLVGCVAAAVIAVATRAGLSTRREAIEIVHGLGATDVYIAGRFAARATVLAAIGAAGGALAALPILLALARLAAPFVGEGDPDPTLESLLAALSLPLWLALPCLPITAAAIGFATAQGAVRRWLRRLP